MITTFTPVTSLLGGVLIGISAVMLMWFLGRIAGATGILAGIFFPASASDWLWRAAMISGMLVAPAALFAATEKMPEITVPVSQSSLIIGGLIVGIGVTLGSGCTSGHGVCGLARFSTRSVLAVLTFMIVAVLTVFVARHVIGG